MKYKNFFIIFAGLLLTISVHLPNPVHAAKFKGKRWAVIIGVQEYKAPIPTLSSPLNDAKAIYEFLKSPQGGSFEDDHIRYLTGAQVTRDSVATALGTFLNQSDHDDYALVYLSGHGMVDPGHTDRYFFLTTEADAGNLPGTAIRMRDIYRWMSEIPARKKLIIADVCHSGAISSSGAVVKGTNAVHDYMDKLGNTYEGMGIFTSSRSTQLSQEFSEEDKRTDPQKRKSVFTYYLLQALSSHATEVDKMVKHDGIVDIKEAYEWVRKKVQEHTRSEQIPDFNGDNETGMPLAVVSGAAVEPVAMSSTNANSPGISRGIPGVSATDAWSSIKDSQNPLDFKDFIKSFGHDPFYNSLAQRKYDELVQKQQDKPPVVYEPVKQSSASAAWAAIKDSQNPADFQDFMNAFPNDQLYSFMAKEKYDALTQKAEEAERKRIQADESAAAASAWTVIKDSKSPEDFQDFMNVYQSNEFYYSMAKRRYDELVAKEKEEQEAQQAAKNDAAARDAWTLIQNSQNPADFLDFMNAFRDSQFYYPMAKRRYGELSAQTGNTQGDPSPNGGNSGGILDEKAVMDLILGGLSKSGKQNKAPQESEQDRLEKEAEKVWFSIRNSTNITDFSNFMRRYRGTKYYYEAKDKYRKLADARDPVPPKIYRPKVDNVQLCKNRVQGRIAWNYSGNKKWMNSSLDRLCRGTTSSSEPPKCFSDVMFGKIYNGTGTRWKWTDAADLCKATNSASRTIDCFKKRFKYYRSMSRAINVCQKK